MLMQLDLPIKCYPYIYTYTMPCHVLVHPIVWTVKILLNLNAIITSLLILSINCMRVYSVSTAL